MGWNGSGGNKGGEAVGAVRAAGSTRAKALSTRTWVVLLGLVVVIGGGIAVWLVFNKPAKSVKVAAKSDSNAKPNAEVRPQAAMPAAKAVESAPAAKAEDDMWLGTKVARRTAFTNDTRIVETIYTVDGKCHKYFRNNTKPIFDNASDQVLALATADTPGGVAPPIPVSGKSFENAFADSLKKEIVINEDDSDEVKAIKERVRKARQDLLDAMGAGMSAQDVFDEHRKMQENNAAMRMEAVRGLREYLDKGDVEGAKEYCAKINTALESMGIMRIELPRSHEEVIAERQARNAQRRAAQQQQENAQ